MRLLHFINMLALLFTHVPFFSTKYTLNKVVATLAFVLAGFSSVAQWHNTGRYHTVKAYGTVYRTPIYEYTPRYRYSAGSNRSYNTLPTYEYLFRIVLKDSSELAPEKPVKINGLLNEIAGVWNNQARVIKPADTREIRYTSDKGVITGQPTDSCWIFQIKKGSINVYSNRPEPDSRFAIAIQKGDTGPVVALTKENLLAMVSDNKRSTKFARNKKFPWAIDSYNGEKTPRKTFLYIVGAVGIVLIVHQVL